MQLEACVEVLYECLSVCTLPSQTERVRVLVTCTGFQSLNHFIFAKYFRNEFLP